MRKFKAPAQGVHLVSVTSDEAAFQPQDNQRLASQPATLITAHDSATSAADKDFVAQYEILDELGRGGMGAIYKTRREGVDKTLALKKLHARFASDQASIKRFEQEARAASLLTHVNLVSVYDFGITGAGEPYLVMDCVQGKSLADVIKETNGISIARFINIFMQVCDAMSHAHSKQVIHRDLKPSNILLADAENEVDLVKIVDFGIAKLMPDAETQEQKLTQTGDVIGSPVYMSPEQCVGARIDGRSDVYSLGCVMYEALMGQPPFLGDNVVQTIVQHLNDKPVPFVDRRPEVDVPADLEKIVLRCLEKLPGQRFQSFDELKDSLELLADTTSNARKQLINKRVARAKTAAWLKANGRKAKFLLTAATVLLTGATIACQLIADDTRLQCAINQAQRAEAEDRVSEALANWKVATEQAIRLHRPDRDIAALALRRAHLLEDLMPPSDALPDLQLARKYLKHSGAVADQLSVLGEIVQNLAAPPFLIDHFTGLEQQAKECRELLNQGAYEAALAKIDRLSQNYSNPIGSGAFYHKLARALPARQSLHAAELGLSCDPNDETLWQDVDQAISKLYGDSKSASLRLKLAADAFIAGDYRAAWVQQTGANRMQGSAAAAMPDLSWLNQQLLMARRLRVWQPESAQDRVTLDGWLDVLSERARLLHTLSPAQSRPDRIWARMQASENQDLMLIGTIYLNLGKLDEATCAYRQALQVAGSAKPFAALQAQSRLSLILAKQADWRQADILMRAAVARTRPDDFGGADELADWFAYCEQTGHAAIARDERRLLLSTWEKQPVLQRAHRGMAAIEFIEHTNGAK